MYLPEAPPWLAPSGKIFEISPPRTLEIALKLLYFYQKGWVKKVGSKYKRTIILRTSAREVACPYLCARDGYADEIVRELSGFCACARENLCLCAEDLPRSCHPFQTAQRPHFLMLKMINMIEQDEIMILSISSRVGVG